MADNTIPYDSNDGTEEFPMLVVTISLGTASTDSETDGSTAGSETTDSSIDSETTSSIADSEMTDSSTDSEITSSIAYSETTNSSAELIFPFEGDDIETAPLLGTDLLIPALPRDFFDLFGDSDDEPGQAAQSLDLREELGVVVILPPGFIRPGLEIRPYHTTHSLDWEFSLFIAFGPNRRITQELADALFVIEVRNPDTFLGNIGDNAQYVGAMHMLEDLYEQLYGSNEEGLVL